METCRRRNVMFYLVTFYYEMLIFRYQTRNCWPLFVTSVECFPNRSATMRIKYISYLASFNSKIAIVRSTKDGRLRDYRATRKYESVFQSVLVI